MHYRSKLQSIYLIYIYEKEKVLAFFFQWVLVIPSTILFYFFRTPFALTIIVKWPLFFISTTSLKAIRSAIKKFGKTALFRFHGSIKQEKIKHAKGQIISKCLFGVLNFFQKTKNKKPHTCENEFIRSFFGRIHSLTI